MSQFRCSVFTWCDWLLHSESHQAEARCQLRFSSGAWGPRWLSAEAVSCGCRAEVLVFLLVIGQEPLSVLGDTLSSLPHALHRPFTHMYFLPGQLKCVSLTSSGSTSCRKGSAFFFFFNLFIYGCVGSSFLCEDFL